MSRYSPWFQPWWSLDLDVYISDSKREIDTWEHGVVKRALEADTEYLLGLGHAIEDIEAATQQPYWDEDFDGTLGRRVLLYKTAWDPRYTSERIYPEGGLGRSVEMLSSGLQPLPWMQQGYFLRTVKE